MPGRGRGSGRGHELEKMVYTKTNVRHTLAMHMSWLTGDLQIPENDLFLIQQLQKWYNARHYQYK